MQNTKILKTNFLSYSAMILDKEFLDILKKDPLKDIVGQEEVKQQLKSALIAGRHVIIVGPPGIGKTTLAKNIAKILPKKELSKCQYHCDPSDPICPECKKKKEKGEKIETKIYDWHELFVRVQGSPELTAEDLIGDVDPIKAIKYGPTSIESFTPGKIFMANNGVLFFDEINRTNEKLQNALLQVIEEGYVTLAGYKIDIPSRFILIATMNPEDKSTEPLSDVFLDRFDIIYMGYPKNVEEETEIIKKSAKMNKLDEPTLRSVVKLIRDLRNAKELEKKPSVRATIGLVERATAIASLNNRNPTMNDVLEVFVSVVSHRIRLKPSIRYQKSEEEFLKEFIRDWMAKNETGDYG